MKLRYLPVALLVLAAAPAPSVAATSEARGLAIAQEMDRRDIGWGDSASSMKMVLANRSGERSIRELRLSNLEITEPGLGDRSLVVFDRPRDVDGTAFLSHTKVNRPDDQWLYLPALKRVKRINSANKSGPFMGSEFAYEDLLSQEVAKYTYKKLPDAACGSLQCFVIERRPVYRDSGYTRQVVWVDKTEYRPMRIEFYDRKASLLKTLVYAGYKKFLGKYWRAHRMQMNNHQTGKSTVLTFTDYRFRVGLNKRSFTASRLKRIR